MARGRPWNPAAALERALELTVRFSPEVKGGRAGLLKGLEKPYRGGMAASHLAYFLARELLVLLSRRTRALAEGWVHGKVPTGSALGLLDLDLLLEPLPGRGEALLAGWGELVAALRGPYGLLAGLGPEAAANLLAAPPAELLVPPAAMAFGVPRRFDPLVPLFHYYRAFPPRVKEQWDVKRRLGLRGITAAGEYEPEVSAVARAGRMRFYEYKAWRLGEGTREAAAAAVRGAALVPGAERERFADLVAGEGILVAVGRQGGPAAALAFLAREGDRLAIRRVARVHRFNVLALYKYFHSLLAATIPEAAEGSDPERRVLVDRSGSDSFRRLTARVRKGMLYQGGSALLSPEFSLLELLYIHTEKYPTATAWLKFLWERLPPGSLLERAGEEVAFNHGLADVASLLVDHFREEAYEPTEIAAIGERVDAVCALDPAALPVARLLRRREELPVPPDPELRPVRVFGLLNGVNALHELVRRELAGRQRLVVRITGPPGTSKTTLAQLIQRHGLGSLSGDEVAAIHFDGYAELGEEFLAGARARLGADVRLVIVESLYSRLYFRGGEAGPALQVLMIAADGLRQNRVKRRDQDVMKREVGDRHYRDFATDLDGKDLVIDTSKDFDLDDVAERLKVLRRRALAGEGVEAAPG